MADTRLTTTRRGLLAASLAIPTAALAAGVPVTPTMPSAASLSAWDHALDAFRRVEAPHTARWKRWEQADEAADRFGPTRPDRFFDEYRLHMNMDRDAIEQALRRHVTRMGQRIDIQRIADEFEEYQRQCRAINDRFQLDRLYREANAGNPAFQQARDVLMRVPAPTVAALLVKIEIAACSLDDAHAEAMLADARRLLSREA